MNKKAAIYVIEHYSRFMTLKEKVVYRHLHATMKATKGRSDIDAQEEARQHRLSRWLSDDPELREMAKDGYELFATRTAERILAEHKEEVLLNYCPRCHELARTPKAQQCRFCGFDWHSVKQTT